jgi:hypothetical protein
VIHAHDSIADAVAELRASPKFREWKPSQPTPSPRTPSIERSPLMKEKHYSPDDLAEMRGVSVDSIRRSSERNRAF